MSVTSHCLQHLAQEFASADDLTDRLTCIEEPSLFDHTIVTSFDSAPRPLPCHAM